MKQSLINETTKYDQFKLIDSNRPVQPKHVQQLKKAIQKKNLLHLNPIIVDAKKNVIDGQHRLQAARELKLPVYYMVDDVINEGDIADLNTNKSNWSVDNYIDYWAKKGNENYIKLRKFIKQRPDVQKSAIFRLMTTINTNATAAIRNGVYKYDNEKEAQIVLTLVSDFSDFKYRFDREFIYAVNHCIDSGEYDHNIMLKKIEAQPGKLERQKTSALYVELLERIYNYHNSATHTNFRMSKKAREKAEKKRQEEIQGALKAQLKAKKQPFTFTRKKRDMNDSVEKTVKVVIDKKTTLFVKPGTDIKALRKKYADKRMMEVGA
ncbi:MAG: ParB N-terminal domain-containing protein [Sediminibacterium sp.]